MRTDEETGETRLSKGEIYHVTGKVTIDVLVDFYTKHEPDAEAFLDDMHDSICELESYDVIDLDELEYEVDEDDD